MFNAKEVVSAKEVVNSKEVCGKREALKKEEKGPGDEGSRKGQHWTRDTMLYSM